MIRIKYYPSLELSGVGKFGLDIGRAPHSRCPSAEADKGLESLAWRRLGQGR